MNEYIDNWNALKEKKREAVYEALSANNSEKPIEQPKEESYPDNWVLLINIAKSSNIPPPNFSSGKKLGHALLDHALERSTRNITNQIDIPFREVQSRLVSELKQNRVAKANALSTLRFLRDADVDLFLECPECGADNEPDWVVCENCKYKNSN